MSNNHTLEIIEKTYDPTKLSTSDNNPQLPPPDNNLQLPPPDGKPPLQLSTILRWAWGITMSLSAQEEQNELVKIFKERFESLINKTIIMDKVDQSYLNEISLIISGMLRSYGFQREVYMTNIKALQAICEVQISYYSGKNILQNIIINQPQSASSNQETDTIMAALREGGMASENFEPFVTSKKTYNGVIPKIIAFAASGSIGFLPLLPELFQELGNKSANIKNLIGNTTLGDIGNSTELVKGLQSLGFDKLIELVKAGESLNLMDIIPILIPLFLIFGAIGYGIYNLIANWYAYSKIKRIKIQETEVLQDFWIKTMKPALIDMFMSLAQELKGLHKRYYEKEDDSLPSNNNELKKYISDKILPHDNTYTYIPKI